MRLPLKRKLWGSIPGIEKLETMLSKTRFRCVNYDIILLKEALFLQVQYRRNVARRTRTRHGLRRNSASTKIRFGYDDMLHALQVRGYR